MAVDNPSTGGTSEDLHPRPNSIAHEVWEEGGAVVALEHLKQVPEEGQHWGDGGGEVAPLDGIGALGHPDVACSEHQVVEEELLVAGDLRGRLIGARGRMSSEGGGIAKAMANNDVETVLAEISPDGPPLMDAHQKSETRQPSTTKVVPTMHAHPNDDGIVAMCCRNLLVKSSSLLGAKVEQKCLLKHRPKQRSTSVQHFASPPPPPPTRKTTDALPAAERFANVS